MEKVKTNLGILLCSVLLMGNYACGNDSITRADSKIVNVKAVQVSTSNEAYEKEYIGSIESENMVDVSFQVSGNVNRVFINEGQNVQKGQILASLNETSLRNTYNSAKASLLQVEDAFKRQTMLYENNSLPEIKYVEIQTQLEQAKASEQIAKKNLGDCKLYAPFAGVIGTKSIEIGSNVLPGVQVMTVMNIGTVKVKIAIPENNISSVHIGDACKVKITAMDNQEFEGKIIEKGVMSHPVSHTYDIKVQLNNNDKKIMPGMVCKAYLNGRYDQGVLIPLKAVQVDFSGKNYVWTINSQQIAERKFVTTGELIGNNALIQKGLRNGDQVVVEGYHKLSPNAKVTLN